MQQLSDVEAEAWCASKGLTVAPGLASARIQLPIQTPRVRLVTRGNAVTLAGLAYSLLLSPSLPRDEAHFEGALVWLQRWELWSESIDRMGYALIGGLRGERAESAGLDQRPAQLFGPEEFVQASACLLIPLIFQWDAFLIPSNGRMVVFMSHEERLEVMCVRDEERMELVERFRSWAPVESDGTD